ncbi:hypothetical protein CVT24_005925, partial [Panaeolus cyanescens]
AQPSAKLQYREECRLQVSVHPENPFGQLKGTLQHGRPRCLLHKVTWEKGDALRPHTFQHILPQVDGVVHTLGTLMEDTAYKRALKEGNLSTLFGSVAQLLVGDRGNPLKQSPTVSLPDDKATYDSLNRDAALRVCQAFLNSVPTKCRKDDRSGLTKSRPFVYISAEDIFRPIIPARYIETKREAEWGIEQMVQERGDQFRGVYIRPSLVYHAHHRPLTTPAAVLFDLSATIHRKIPRNIPTPVDILRSLGAATSSAANDRSGMPSSLDSIANALSTPPIHVDHVADAIVESLVDEEIKGVVNVDRMRKLVGWSGENTRGDSITSASRYS